MAPKPPDTTVPKTPQQVGRRNVGLPAFATPREFEEATAKPRATTTKKTTKKTPPSDKNKDKNKRGMSIDEAVKQNYPQFSYMLDNPDFFGQDVVAIFRRATKENWTPDRFAGAIQATQYWQNTVGAAKNFDAAPEADKQTKIDNTLREINSVTEVGSLDQGQVAAFARDMARRGLTGDALRQMTYQFVFRQGVETEAAQQALFTESAAQMRRIGKAYGASLTDDQVRKYLEDGKTPQNLQAMYREKMKAQYPHLSSQLDADLTFEDIVEDYRQMAAQILERSPDQIDFSKPEFVEAVATRDPNGNTRQLSLGEWSVKLKTDDRYGYSKTNTAIQQARTLASNIARTFGRVI